MGTSRPREASRRAPRNLFASTIPNEQLIMSSLVLDKVGHALKISERSLIAPQRCTIPCHEFRLQPGGRFPVVANSDKVTGKEATRCFPEQVPPGLSLE